ncbi:trans-2-enoyl-CoA reductase [Acrasis kona]|uniref:Enoyl-[acyl-carrier-protein] reductase, mitochondrial n=1 Tax=Acrasis kona TaxID=1008807 RepID=A0AAW2ZI08_9EUKA
MKHSQIAKSLLNNGTKMFHVTNRGYAKESLVAQYKQYGNVRDVLKMETVQLSDLQPNQVLVKMLAAPVNPADLNMIQGNYGKKAESFPAVGGNEGVGVIEEVGSAVTNLKVNQRVIPAKSGFGTWRTYAVASESDLIQVPDDIPVEFSSVLSVNPMTAYRLLNDFADLKEGDVVVQNAPNSAVGLCVIQLAKQRGIRTINILRSPRPDQDTAIERLKELGGTIVVTDQYASSANMRELVSDLPKAKLGLNATGGEGGRAVARFLGEDAQFVTYGGMSRQPITLPTSPFIFNNITARGFWLTKWSEKANVEERKKLLHELSNMFRDKKLVMLIKNERFSELPYVLPTIEEPFREKKVVLKF